DFYALLSATEWADPETQTFKELLWKMTDEEFDARKVDRMHMDETGGKSRCVDWLEGSFTRELDMPIAA
ncbi:MAG: hypothetical protein HKN35_02545, partial [Woeseia sp.]|nr:hypothetical protein [Woeseia sp.]